MNEAYRGSRKHVLDWTGQRAFLPELAGMAAPAQVIGLESASYMPQGYAAPDEARLESFGPARLPDNPAWDELQRWWLKHPRGANTPNWDIAVGCIIENRPGLMLVEAKANWPELNTAGKASQDPSRSSSIDNHLHIGAAIAEACEGWRRLDARISISRDSHYQLANRLAFTWKLAQLGIPVVLIYLGFLGDEGIRDAGTPFSDDADWQHAFGNYIRSAFPTDLLGRRIDAGKAPAWILSRSRLVLEQSTEKAP